MPIEYTELILGISAISIWFWILFTSSRGPLGWASPTGLYALGLLLFYIIPSIYWLFRPWTYSVPSYLEGLIYVFSGVIVLSLPFLVKSLRFFLRKMSSKHIVPPNYLKAFGWKLWIILLPICLGIGWRLYLFSLGFQSRLGRELPTLFGSESLAFLMSNVVFWYPVCSFALVAFGGKNQRRVGYGVWVIDGLLQIGALHRQAMLFFIIRSIVFLKLLGYKLTRKQWVVISCAVIFVISIVGETHSIAYRKIATTGGSYLGLSQVLEVLEETTAAYLTRKSEKSTLLKTLDDTMFRLYDARSASAVMMNVPKVIPFYYGETFLHVFYAWIPRYFWEDKPSLGEVHFLTTRVMPNDSGINPMGTVAELYINYGFIAVLGGGLISFWICQWSENAILRNRSTQRAWICIYPVLSLWFIGASYNLSQRLSEGLRCILVIWFFSTFLWYAKKKIRVMRVSKPSASVAIQ
jgi:hypothetical protein